MPEGRITISPTVQILSVPATGSSNNRSTLPAEIAQLTSGSTLKGFVVNRDKQNNPIIRTDKGDVSIRSELFLKTGSEVALKIEKNVAGANARLVSVDGESVKTLIEQVTKQNAQSSSDSVSKSALQNSSGTQSAQQVANAASQTVLKAIILQPITQAQIKTLPQALQTLAQNLIEGKSLEVRIVATTGSAAEAKPAQPLQTVAQQQNTLSPAQLSSAYSRYSGRPTPLAPTTTSTMATQQSSLNVGSVSFQINQIAASALKLQGNVLPAPLASLFSKAEIMALLTAQKTSTATSTAPLTASTSTLAATTTQPSPTPPPLAPAPVQGVTTPVAPPAATSPTPPPLPATPPPAVPLQVSSDGNYVTAQVIGNEKGGYATVQTPIGVLRIPTANPLTVGGIITLELTHALRNVGALTQQSSTLPAAQQQGPQEWLGISRDWTALNSIMAILQDADPATSQHVMHRSFAHSDKSMTKGLLFFLTALRGNNPREWLGVNLMNHHDARIQELVKKVVSEFSAMRPMSTEQPDQPWQSAFIPFMHEREPEQLRVFWRNYDKDPVEEGKKGERFIIEATLSELGELQFDGLVNTKTNPTSFDLAIRTPKPLDEIMKRDIHSLFLSAAEVTGFAGQLRFYEKPEHMEHPLEDMVKAMQQKVASEGIDSRSILA